MATWRPENEATDHRPDNYEPVYIQWVMTSQTDISVTKLEVILGKAMEKWCA